jgi:type I restriction enzyme S subunit
MSAPEIPPGWALARLPELIAPGGRFVDGDWVESKDQDPQGAIRLTQLADVGDGVWRNRSSRFLTPEKAEQLRCTLLERGDVLVARMPDPLGRSCVFPGASQDCVTVVDVCIVRPAHDGVSTRWLSHFVNAPQFRSAIYRLQSGSTRKRISRMNLGTLELRIPPSNEQHRLADAIESYFTRLDDGVATLERVQRNLKRYRASVLKTAVEGRLVPTEAELARAEGRDYEPASVLLERILAERRRRWEEAELAKMKAKGKAPTDDRWKAKYKEPVAPETEELPELPEGWCWATVDILAAVKGGITKGQKRKHGERYRPVAYLRVANVQRGFLDLSDIKTIEASESQIDELRLEPGDVLFNEGGDRDKLGRGWIWRGEITECIHQNHVFRARVYTDDLCPELLSWYGNTTGQQYFFDEGKQTTNLASINMTKLRGLPVPVPPRAEQRRIRETVAQQLSIADAALGAITHEVVRCARLRQSILKWAFEGRLADQDPTDEPASALLERIRAERASATADKLKRRARRNARSPKA